MHRETQAVPVSLEKAQSDFTSTMSHTHQRIICLHSVSENRFHTFVHWMFPAAAEIECLSFPCSRTIATSGHLADTDAKNSCKIVARRKQIHARQ